MSKKSKSGEHKRDGDWEFELYFNDVTDDWNVRAFYKNVGWAVKETSSYPEAKKAYEDERGCKTAWKRLHTHFGHKEPK